MRFVVDTTRVEFASVQSASHGSRLELTPCSAIISGCWQKPALIFNRPLLGALPISIPLTERMIDLKKKSLGQFFTVRDNWLLPHVVRFIDESDRLTVLDPFAGSGDIVNQVRSRCHSIRDGICLDIDETLGWMTNDSLVNIPHVKKAIIVTNPPYLTNYSAARKKILGEVKRWFDVTEYDDLYLLAIDRMLEASDRVVAIVPETFINSAYKRKDRLSSITVLEDSPFEDTETPVSVVCFDGDEKPLSNVDVYVGEERFLSLADIEGYRMKPSGAVKVRFNDTDGWLAIRCIDSTNPNEKIRFGFKDDFDYDWESRIKVSSRLMTLVDVAVEENMRIVFVQKCNEALESLRRCSHDLVLSPFKGNNRDGKRRRRIDYTTIRAILEKAKEGIN